ncbi:Arc family DNA binding domain-containing protein [Candidatus Clostridium stratigraminis]|uniref:Arc family DNA binding domain-containing protein n=1 Tax=Candidatus Clostridium stratigraminis TaxID=3381661 RepID=A0ABW8T4Z0_9CLOT
MSDKKTVLLRLSPKAWEEINRWAEEEFRSVNGQIEYLLTEAIKKRNKSFLKDEEK